MSNAQGSADGSAEELLGYIVRSFVENPDAVAVEVGERRGEPVLRLTVAEADRGSVIGRQGRTIRAIETVLSAAPGPRFGLEVVD